MTRVLVLLVAGAVSGAAWAATDEPAEAAGADRPADPPLTLCTAPWPPFVETVPPPRPPSDKPDPDALGFRETAAGLPGRALASGVPAAGDDHGPVRPPPLPEALADAEAAGPAAPANVSDPTPETARSAPVPQDTRLPVLAVTPLSEVEVVPPPAPVEKRAGRIAQTLAAARRGLAGAGADSAEPDAPVPMDGPLADDTAAEAETDPEIAPTTETGAGPVDPPDPAETEAPAATVAAADANQDPGREPEPEPGPGTGTGTGGEGDLAPSAAPEADSEATTGRDGRPTLRSLQMPTARALMPQGRAGGPLAEVVQAACREAGLDCRIALVPWMRPRSHLEAGTCDAVFPVEDTAESRPYMTFSDPLVESELAFFTMNTGIRSVSDLTEYIVLARGPSQAARHAEAAVGPLYRTALVLGPDLDSLIRRLSALDPADRVALYGNYHVVTRAMDDLDVPIPALNVVRHRGQVFRVGFARNRVPGPVREAFDDGLARIRQTREWQEILEIGALAPLN
ncbi:ABC-type amino acid transport substrate-binding protein [Roseospira goensis]|uniref:ABC-type amino acid transport substrate-binding protein n=1 Tax=Roseospira goensis TaxID=391922 RepID=A0A7W6RYR2_9PROT|nr:ABC-type amino acid transport substrate-binding protein [Roseospira goensis]